MMSPLNTLKKLMPPRRSRHSPEDSLIKQDVDHECTKRLPAARRFVTLRASGNNVMRKLEVHVRWLGGSSRFTQAQTTSCGSLKFIVCWFGGSSRFAQAQTTSCGSSQFIICWLGSMNPLRGRGETFCRGILPKNLHVCGYLGDGLEK